MTKKANKKPEPIIITGEMLRDKIYTIRGQKVMLDYDLAEIYGYTTKAFNQQVKNNIEKFDEDFRFQLSKEECVNFLRSKNLTSKIDGRGGKRYLPYAFTEPGIYMLMTVLKGEMRDMDERIALMEGKAEDMLTKSDISPILLDFNKLTEQKEFVILDGEPMRASEVYTDIYRSAKKSIFIIDDYISIKTLRHLQSAKDKIEIIVFSDNIGKHLHKNDYVDFIRERKDLSIKFIKTKGKIHDRFVILDYDTENETIYHCGASEKDAGRKLTVITRYNDGIMREVMDAVIKDLTGNDDLVLA